MRTVVVNKSQGFGDLIYSTPTMRKIREFFPSDEIELYTHVPEVFEGSPYVNKVVQITPSTSARFTEIVRGARLLVPFDLPVATQRRLCTSIISLIDLQALLAIDRTLPEREHYCDLYWQHEQSWVAEQIKKLNIDVNRLVVLHAGKTWPTRTFPDSVYFATLDGLVSLGYQVVLVGKSSTHAPNVFDPARPNVLNLVNKLSLHQTAALCDVARVVLATDSGLLAIARCTDAKVISIHTCVEPYYRRQWRGGATGSMLHRWYPMHNNTCRCYDGLDVSMDIYNCPKKNFRCFPSADQILEHVDFVVKTELDTFQYGWDL